MITKTRADGMVVISSSGEGIKDIQSELPISISFSERKRDFLRMINGII